MDFHVSVLLEDFDRSCGAALRAGFLPEVRITDAERMRSLDDGEIARMRGILGSEGAAVFTHGPFLGLDIASLDDHVARYSAGCLERGSRSRPASAGRRWSSTPIFRPSSRPPAGAPGCATGASGCRRFLAAARRLGVRVAFENVWERTPESLAYLLDALPRGEAFVCLDTGHLAAFSRLPVKRWWDALGDRVIALHLHDNDGSPTTICPPARGSSIFPPSRRYCAGATTFPS